jgi:hypothetical protein
MIYISRILCGADGGTCASADLLKEIDDFLVLGITPSVDTEVSQVRDGWPI